MGESIIEQIVVNINNYDQLKMFTSELIAMGYKPLGDAMVGYKNTWVKRPVYSKQEKEE